MKVTSVVFSRACIALFVGAAISTIGWLPVDAQDTLPRPEPPFKGRIGRTAKDSVPDFPKEVQPRFDFKYDGGGIGKGGMGTLSVDGKQVAQSHIERTVCCRFSLDETFDVGSDTGSPVIEDYDSQMPFRFTGTLEKLTIELAPQSMNTEDQRELERRQLAGAISTE